MFLSCRSSARCSWNWRVRYPEHRRWHPGNFLARHVGPGSCAQTGADQPIRRALRNRKQWRRVGCFLGGATQQHLAVGAALSPPPPHNNGSLISHGLAPHHPPKHSPGKDISQHFAHSSRTSASVRRPRESTHALGNTDYITLKLFLEAVVNIYLRPRSTRRTCWIDHPRAQQQKVTPNFSVKFFHPKNLNLGVVRIIIKIKKIG